MAGETRPLTWKVEHGDQWAYSHELALARVRNKIFGSGVIIEWLESGFPVLRPVYDSIDEAKADVQTIWDSWLDIAGLHHPPST